MRPSWLQRLLSVCIISVAPRWFAFTVSDYPSIHWIIYMHVNTIMFDCQVTTASQCANIIWTNTTWFIVKSITTYLWYFLWMRSMYLLTFFAYWYFFRNFTLNVWGLSYLGLTRSVSWLLMPWLLASPGDQSPWYWPCGVGRSVSYLRKDFNYQCHIKVEEWHKMFIYVYVPCEKFST